MMKPACRQTFLNLISSYPALDDNVIQKNGLFANSYTLEKKINTDLE